METNDKLIYLTPEVEITEIRVEQGFSGSLEHPEFDGDDL